MKKIESHTVPKLEKPERLSDYAANIFKAIPSKKGMKKAIDKGLVKINDERGYSADYINGGETIELFEKEIKTSKRRHSVKLEVLYEDDYLAIINKPAGVVVSGNQDRTIENSLSFNLKKSVQIDALTQPMAIHRLDFPTSGALLIGKTRSVVTALNKLFEERKVDKYYHAISIGKSKISGKIDAPIKGKKAETLFELIKKIDSDKYGSLNLLRLKAVTGRRHQLRIHLSDMKTPILGDVNYGIEGKISRGSGLYLHASTMEFKHPISGEEIKITIALPKKFLKIFPNDQ